MYVFDTSSFSSLFTNFYPLRFPTLWAKFDALVAAGSITSTREVARELEQYTRVDEAWLRNNVAIFTTPTQDEAYVVRNIYRVAHFRHNIEQKKIYKGGLNADPFVVAKAVVIGGTVVTLERKRPNAAKIPNICDHLQVQCLDLEEFMERECWQF